MAATDRALMAHLMRRAGFGATPDEIDAYVANGYEATVEALLSPKAPRSLPEDLIRRYHVDQSELRLVDSAVANWLYRMVSPVANRPCQNSAIFSTSGASVETIRYSQLATALSTSLNSDWSTW